jgi:hypothetical protein
MLLGLWRWRRWDLESRCMPLGLWWWRRWDTDVFLRGTAGWGGYWDLNASSAASHCLRFTEVVKLRVGHGISVFDNYCTDHYYHVFSLDFISLFFPGVYITFFFLEFISLFFPRVCIILFCIGFISYFSGIRVWDK